MDIEENARMTFASTKLDPVSAILRPKVRDMAGNNPELQAYAGSYGQAFGFSVLPGLGLVAMMSAVVLTIIQAVRPRL